LKIIGFNFKCNENDIIFKVEKENQTIESYLDILYEDGSTGIKSTDDIRSKLKTGKIETIGE
jgi:hypothetical protein